MAKVLVVEDQVDLACSIRDWLLLEGHQVDVCLDGNEAAAALRAADYDVVLLDVMLPQLDGFALCDLYRRNGGTARILIITAKAEVSDKEYGLNCGADDYITKPFDLNELSARIRALMRRTLDVAAPEICYADLSMDLNTHKVLRAGREIRLSPQEFALLEFLVRQPNRIFSAETLAGRVWAEPSSVSTVRTHIKTLRKKIDANASQPLIKTIHGIGYSLSDR